VPESVREAFSSSVAGLGHDTLEAGERELARLTVLKKEMLGTLIEEARTQVRPTFPAQGLEKGGQSEGSFISEKTRAGSTAFMSPDLTLWRGRLGRCGRRWRWGRGRGRTLRRCPWASRATATTCWQCTNKR
jgi:hypothetical protein